jgi:hypothetical protein
MLLLKGTRTARIRTYSDHEHRCDSCKEFDMSVAVYQPYFHFFFIPIAPNGEKSVKVYCKNCSQPFRKDSMNRVYEEKTKTPFYLYTFTIFVGLIIVLGFSVNIISHWRR